MARAQEYAGNLEGQLAELKVQNQQVAVDLAKAKDERDASVDKLMKLKAKVTELWRNEALAKRKVIEEFKASDDF